MAVRDALDDAMKTEAAKVVGQLSGGIISWIQSQQLRHEETHFRIGEPAQLEAENDQHGEQGLDALVTEPQSRSPLAIDLGRPDYPIERVLADRAIVGIFWTSRRRRLAWKPICRRAGRFFSSLPIPKSRVLLMVVSVRSARPSL